MSGSLNRVQLIGNVGRDPEIRTTQGGQKVANLSIATSETWKDKQSGERREATQWHKIIVWSEGIVGVVEKYVSKGSKIYIEGQLQHRKYNDQAGAEKWVSEVVLQNFNGKLVLLSGGNASREPEDENQDAGGREYGQENKTGGNGYGAGGADLDDDVPFSPSFF